MRRLATRMRAVWRVLWRAQQLETEMQEEMRFHVEMETERLVREQELDPQEARRQACVRFGGVEKFKEEGRDARGRQWLDAVALDTRLGVRMLVKYRGLTLIGGFAMAVAIAIGATFFEIISQMLNAPLPFEDGERVVALEYASANDASALQTRLHDFVTWRDQLTAIEQLGAFRTVQHNFVAGVVADPVADQQVRVTGGARTGDAPPEPIKVAEITASGFAVARTAPLLGRYLLPDDERAGASPVVVIGYQAWEARFASDRQIVGRTIHLGGVPHTVIGVMPDGFRFPYDHQFWIPFRGSPMEFERFKSPQLSIFGRLVRGVTMEQAQAELTAIGQRAVDPQADTGAPLRPVVLPYTRAHLDLTHPMLVWTFRLIQLLVGALSCVVAVNLAILVYARTVTRLGEIAVRAALGASRRRILAQLFIEAFALSVVGAATGLVLADVALGCVQSLAHANGGMPFWIGFDLSIGTVIYAVALAVFAAAIMGVLPGLTATGSRLAVNLHELNGRTGTRLGPMWATLVVAQVAVAVAVLPAAVYVAWQELQIEVAGPGFAAEKFVVGTVAVRDDNAPVNPTRIRQRQLELMSRLQAEPGVSAVTFSSSVPGFAGGRRIQFDASSLDSPSTALSTGPSTFLSTERRLAAEADSFDVSTIDVALDIFDVYEAGILAGRAFNAGDLDGANAVIVNRTFVQALLGNRSALGVRFRYTSPQTQQPGTDSPQPWYQIVGVVRDFPSFPPALSVDGEPVVFHAAAPGAVHPVVLSVRFDGNIPGGFTDRVRRIGAEVDPALQLRRVVPLSQFYNDVRSFWRYLAWGIGLVTASVLLLSAAGIYALMSFTVAQRTREIGIRVALGAHPRRLLLGIFGRVVRQIALGVIVGSLVSGAVFFIADLGVELATSLLLAVAALMLIVGVVAALGPARRSLRVQAAESLRADT